MKNNIILNLTLSILTAFALNCADENSEDSPEWPGPVKATGLWQGKWKSSNIYDLSGIFSADIIHTENDLTGKITILALDLEDAELTGTANVNKITFGDINNTITFSGTINGQIDTGSGNYNYQSSTDTGTWEASCTRRFTIEDKIDISTYNLFTPTGFATDGSYFYLSEGPQAVDKLDMDGNLINVFLYNEEVVRNFESLAYDGVYLWGTDEEADKICKMDMQGEVISEYESPGGPHNIAGPIQIGIASDGEKIWVLDYNTKNIHRMDNEGVFHESFPYTEHEDDEYQDYPSGFGYGADHLWISSPVGDYMTGAVYKIDPSTGQTVRRYFPPVESSDEFNSRPGDLASDGTSMWIVNRDYIYKISEAE